MPHDHPVGAIGRRGERCEREARAVGGENRVRSGQAVEITEDPDLQVESLRDTLDDQIGRADGFLEACREGEPSECRVGLGAVELAALDCAFEPISTARHPRAGLLDGIFVHIRAMDVVASLRQDLGDSTSHHPGSNYRDSHLILPC